MSQVFAVKVTLTDAEGCTHDRTYVQHSISRLTRDEFCSAALGNLIAMVTTGYSDSLNIAHSDTDKRHNGQTWAKGTMPIVEWTVESVPVPVA